MRCRLLFVVLMLPLVTACSAYHPLSGGVGYSEVPLGADAFQVTFTGEGAMPVAEARQYALTRAAELTVLRNGAFFEILDERIFIGYGTSYTPATYYPAGGWGGRRWGGGHWGRGYGYYGGYYDPGYVQTYMIPEVTMQVRVVPGGTANAIPAAYLLRQAEGRNMELNPAVRERLASLPAVAGEVTLPAAPQPVTRPGTP
jgi:hypothetical protein